MDNKIEVIGVDVGNGYTKTVSTEFVSATRDWGEVKPPLTDKLVGYAGKYYTVGGERTKTKTDQKNDETCLILALAGIAEELRRRGKQEGRILLSEGLPLERCIEENKLEDEEYYKKGQIVEFTYEDEPYKIEVVDVMVNPQCVAAIVEKLCAKEIPQNCIIVDIGSWTIEILPIENYKPQGAKAQSLNMGIIDCLLKCNEAIRRRTGKEIPEYMIQQAMLGDAGTLPPKYATLCINELKAYAKNLAETLEENKYNTDVVPCVFMGGGSSIIKNYGEQYFPLSMYMMDETGKKPNIRINAIGYEKLGKSYLHKKGLA